MLHFFICWCVSVLFGGCVLLALMCCINLLGYWYVCFCLIVGYTYAVCCIHVMASVCSLFAYG